MITLSSTDKKEPIPVLIKIDVVARLLSVSRNTVHSLIQAGDLDASEITASSTKPGRRHRRVTRKSLLKFYRKRFGHDLNHALETPFAS